MNPLQTAAASPVMLDKLATAPPEYISYLKSMGIIPADWAPPVVQAPVAPAPTAVVAPMAPVAPTLTTAPVIPVDPMQQELARYFGVIS